jgi:hypothetical protein
MPSSSPIWPRLPGTVLFEELAMDRGVIPIGKRCGVTEDLLSTTA